MGDNRIYYILGIYYILINLIGYILMKLDKQRAKKHQYRISEKTLWTIAFLLGALGLYIGMNHFRHKTKHTSFKVGLPLLSLLELVVMFFLLYVLA